MERIEKPKASIKNIIIIALVIAVYAVASVLSYLNMNQSLFEERSENTKILMEKISQNVETGIDTRWNSIRHLSNQFADEAGRSEEVSYSVDEKAVGQTISTLADVEKWLEKTKSYRNENILGLFVIDDKGVCYTSSGDTFKWSRRDLLNSGRDEVHISSDELRISENEELRMFFLKPLPTVIDIEGIRMTHIAISTEMEFVDPFFNTEEFGDESVAFIIRSNGTQIYRQEKDNSISKVYNVRSALESAEYKYGGSYNLFNEDIENGRANCLNLVYGGESYYLAYHPMETNNWVSMMLIPEDNVGSASRTFMWSIIVSIALISLGGMAIFIIIFVSGSRRNNKQKELVNRQLVKAAEAERNANNAKTQFLSSMSHDIRTPMNAIIGMTTLASKHLDDPDYMRDCLANVSLASNHLLTLINDVLDISKVESGKMSLNPIVFSLADTATNLVNIIKQQIDTKKQSFNIRVHNVKNEYLFADELRLNQIFINILSNAVKYTPEGGRINVDLKEEESEKESSVRIVYIVEDTGVGMTEEFIKTMYDSFVRASTENVGAIQGTGLGLAICKQMVDLMGGTIECESQVGVGTKFTVTLDLPIAEKVTSELMLPHMKLLLVDDDEVFLETASDTLKSMGITPDVVSTGEDAVIAVEEKHNAGQDYPVVVIDWRLPGINGIETARRIRAIVGDEIPIIVISAYDFSEIEDEARGAGVNGFISKPFFRSTVYSDMCRILGIGEEHASEQKSELPDVHGLNLLVAEDNDLNWEIASEILSMYDIKTTRAENGKICVDMIEAASDGEFDMILMDIQMPVMNGYEATRCIRASRREYVKNIPIIAMTADAFADDIQRCLDAGMNAHIAKPINVSNLLTIIGNRGGGVTLPRKG